MKISLTDIKLVVCDIDGTLTHDGTIFPSTYTLDIIEKLHQKNIKFGIASGRDVNQLKELRDSWKLSFDFDLLIGLNGSEYYDLETGKHELYDLKSEDIKEIITKMDEFYPGLNASIYRNDLRYLRYEDAMALESKKRNKMNNHIVGDVSEMWDGSCPKVMFRVSEEVMKQVEPYAISISNERFRACKTQTTMLEFVNKNADKGNALKKYCEVNGIALDNVAAFGDMTNDNEMLVCAGTGVAMINGSDDCKACANYISEYDNNHDGCAKFIEKYIL